MISDSAFKRAEKFQFIPFLFVERKLCSRVMLKSLKHQASGGGQTSSLLRVSNLVFELIQCTLLSAATVNVSG